MFKDYNCSISCNDCNNESLVGFPRVLLVGLGIPPPPLSCGLCCYRNTSPYGDILRRKPKVNSDTVIPSISERNSVNIDSSGMMTENIEEHNQDESSVDGISISLTAEQEGHLFDSVSTSDSDPELDGNYDSVKIFKFNVRNLLKLLM